VARDVEVNGIEKVLLERSRAQAASRRRLRSLAEAAAVEAAAGHRTGARKTRSRTQELLARTRASASGSAQGGLDSGAQVGTQVQEALLIPRTSLHRGSDGGRSASGSRKQRVMSLSGVLQTPGAGSS
jgi:hypothetical protein